MRKLFLSVLLVATISAGAQEKKTLAGYEYGTLYEPTGNEWESPEKVALNKQQPHAYFFDFADNNEADRKSVV